jgi:hypothetical protein
MPREVLPPFTPESKCVKCAGTVVETTYLGTRVAPRIGPRRWSDEEAVMRECRGCGFQWKETPADAKPITPMTE